MPAEANFKLYSKSILPAILGISVAALGIYAVGSFKDYFTMHPFFAAVTFFKSVGIDVLGAIIPLIVSIVSAALLIGYFELPTKKFATTLMLSASLAFLLFHLTDEGVAGSPLLFTVTSSAIAVAVNVLPRTLTHVRKFISSLLSAVSCIPLSLFAVDLFYSFFFVDSVIGGNGLSDGLIVSTLYAFTGVTLIYSILVYASQTVWLIRNQKNSVQ